MGVDGVKVDAQSVLSSLRLRQGKGGYDLVLAYHMALQRSVRANFGVGGGGHIQDESSATNVTSTTTGSVRLQILPLLSVRLTIIIS